MCYLLDMVMSWLAIYIYKIITIMVRGWWAGRLRLLGIVGLLSYGTVASFIEVILLLLLCYL